jgi:hypothetical protein
LCYSSTSKASPNDTGIVIVIIIIVIIGEGFVVQHCGGIIAQSFRKRLTDFVLSSLYKPE